MDIDKVLGYKYTDQGLNKKEEEERKEELGWRLRSIDQPLCHICVYIIMS